MRCLVLPVSVISHPTVVIIPPVAEHPGALGDFGLVDLALGVISERTVPQYGWVGAEWRSGPRS